MKCSHSPLLQNWELLAVMDGDGSAEVMAHITSCRACRQHIEAFTAEQKALQAIFHQVTCPTGEELGAYFLKVLPVREAEFVTRHLPHCLQCTRELVELQRYMQKMPTPTRLEPPESVVSRLTRFVGQMMGGNAEAQAWAVRNQSNQPPLSADDDDGSIRYEFGEGILTLWIDDDPMQPSRQHIMGFVEGMDVEELKVYLWRSEAPDESYVEEVDELGNFVISRLKAAEYDLMLAGEGVEVLIEGLKIR